METKNFIYSIKLSGIERKQAANVVSGVTGDNVKYLGAPSMSYQVGEWIVGKAGEIVSPELSKTDKLEEVFTALDSAGGFSEGNALITIPMEGHTGVTLRNLVNLFASKQNLIFKALKTNSEMNIKHDFIDAVNKTKIASKEDFMGALASSGGDEASPAIEFDGDRIIFRCFPATFSCDAVKAYIQFVNAINQQALSQKHTTSRETVTDNEKYTFRVWLLRLGFIGNDFKTTRNILLKGLSGNAAFRAVRQEEETPIPE